MMATHKCNIINKLWVCTIYALSLTKSVCFSSINKPPHIENIKGAEFPVLKTIPWEKVDIRALSVETHFAGIR